MIPRPLTLRRPVRPTDAAPTAAAATTDAAALDDGVAVTTVNNTVAPATRPITENNTPTAPNEIAPQLAPL
jgi:hypothetical protein